MWVPATVFGPLRSLGHQVVASSRRVDSVRLLDELCLNLNLHNIIVEADLYTVHSLNYRRWVDYILCFITNIQFRQCCTLTWWPPICLALVLLMMKICFPLLWNFEHVQTYFDYSMRSAFRMFQNRWVLFHTFSMLGFFLFGLCGRPLAKRLGCCTDIWQMFLAPWSWVEDTAYWYARN